eukprot:12415407-Karenia_brevis.AAC.1
MTAWDAVTRRKPRDGKGGGKGNQGGSFNEGIKQFYAFKKNNLSFGDRQKHVAKLEARTTCSDCGDKGHGSGDPE